MAAISLTDEVPGTGQTVQDLLNQGFTLDDINNLTDISMATNTPGPTLLPARVTDPSTASAQNWLNSAGAFGTSLVSILSGKPVVVNSQGRAIGAPGSTVAATKPSISGGTILLIALGIFLVVKLAK